MRINWAESWQLTSEIIEMLEIDLPIQEQERIASLLHSKDGEVWMDFNQEWTPYRWPKIEQQAFDNGRDVGERTAGYGELGY